MKKLLLLMSVVCVLFGAGCATTYAHQPYAIGAVSTITVPDPEVSKAYYAELTGSPAVYSITSDKPFELYLNLLVPDITGVTKDFSAEVKDQTGKEITKLDGEYFTWEHWYEEFAGDWYWKGPEFKQEVPAGTYTVTVSNPTNTGKYVLAPGEQEVFTLAGTPHTIWQIYLTKTQFFGKPWYSLYQGIIGKSLLIVKLILIAIAVLVYFVLRKRRKNISKL